MPDTGTTRSLAADVNGHGPAVVLLHGQPGRADNWRRTTDRLTDRYTTVAPDRLGYGRTGGPAGDFRANADATVALLDRLAIDQAIVVGYSWGGAVAIDLAASAPERVAGLVFVASVAPGDTIGRVDRLLANRPVGDLAALASLGVVSRALSVPALRWAAERMLPAGPRHFLVQSVRSSDGWRSFATEQRVFVGQIDALGEGLSKIAVPTHVVFGTADRVLGPRAGALLAGRIPGATLNLVRGGGHLLPWEHPEAVTKAIDAVAGANLGG